MGPESIYNTDILYVHNKHTSVQRSDDLCISCFSAELHQFSHVFYCEGNAVPIHDHSTDVVQKINVCFSQRFSVCQICQHGDAALVLRVRRIVSSLFQRKMGDVTILQ